MQQLVNIRRSTGIGRESLASFLGMSRQFLLRVEKGMYSLNTESLLKLNRLQACLDHLAITADKKQMPLLYEQDHDSNREKECRYFITVQQRKLAKHESCFQKQKNLYQALCMLSPTGEGDELWIEKTKKDIIKKLDKCGPAACMRLRKRIYLLTAEADYISRIVNENQIHL